MPSRILIVLLGCFGFIPSPLAQESYQKINPWSSSHETEREFSGYTLKRQSENVPKSDYVCYQDIGCFYKHGTFKHLNGLPDSPKLVNTTFALYTRRNPKIPVYMNYLDYTTVFRDELNPKKELKVICHGFAMSGKSSYLIDMKNALLKEDDCNVIIIDWSKGALPPFYLSAAMDTELVGRQVARLTYLLVKYRGILVERVHLIGFSLGSHLSGFAGKWLKKEYGLTVARISALDPASFSFENKGSEVHVSSKDADFVDVIHTSAGTNMFTGELGMTEPVGHVDFYPNGGKKQPGCWGLICNHMRALELFTSSIESTCRFRAVHCENFDIFDDGGCFRSDSKSSQMGYYSRLSEGRGTMYLATSALPPYCGTSILVIMRVSEEQKPTYCGISITLIGKNGTMEHINVTDSNSQKVNSNEILKKHAVINSSILPLSEVRVQYRTYKGWFYTGTPNIYLKDVMVKDDKNHTWFKHFNQDIKVSSSSEYAFTV